MASTGKRKSKNISINNRKLSKLIVCEWCGAMIIQEYPNQKYCKIENKPCKYYAELERNNKYRKKSNKPLLGSSNLGQHRQKEGN